KTSPPETVSDAYDVYERLDPHTWAVEAVAGHQFFFHWLASTYQSARIRPLKTDPHKSKLTRIRGFNTFFANQRFYVHREHTDFMDEYCAFPNGRTVDLLDAVAYTPQIWFPPEDYRGEEEDEWGGDLVRDDPEREAAAAEAHRSDITGY